jgi:lipoyl(octanoyl) transferase
LVSPARLLNLGLTTYADACDLQVLLHEARAANRIEDILIITEHLPVYTRGRTARPEHLAGWWDRNTIDGIPVCITDRGGSVTYHGPGQLVGYPILELRRYCAGPKAYVGLLEEVLIRGLSQLAIVSTRQRGKPGVWVDGRKIGAIGVRISKGVTRHGFALNVTNELHPFSAVLPCGLSDCVVTSVARESVGEVTFSAAMQAVTREFQEVFELSWLDGLRDMEGKACTPTI